MKLSSFLPGTPRHYHVTLDAQKGSQGIKPAGNLSTNVSEFLNRRFPQSRRHNCVRSLIIQIVTLKSQNKPLVGR